MMNLSSSTPRRHKSMGSIKNKNLDSQEKSHTLTEAEFNSVMNLNVAKQNIINDLNKAISSYLKGIASTRLGYEYDTDLQFELDFADEKHILKITELPKKQGRKI